MRIQFLTDVLSKYGEDGWEDADTKPGETAEQCANRIVDYFNDTLHPREEARKVIAVRIIDADAKPKVEHQWQKTNSFTLKKGKWYYDAYVCLNCSATAKRYGFGDIIVDYRDRARQHCPGKI